MPQLGSAEFLSVRRLGSSSRLAVEIGARYLLDVLLGNFVLLDGRLDLLEGDLAVESVPLVHQLICTDLAIREGASVGVVPIGLGHCLDLNTRVPDLFLARLLADRPGDLLQLLC